MTDEDAEQFAMAVAERVVAACHCLATEKRHDLALSIPLSVLTVFYSKCGPRDRQTVKNWIREVFDKIGNEAFEDAEDFASFATENLVGKIGDEDDGSTSLSSSN